MGGIRAVVGICTKNVRDIEVQLEALLNQTVKPEEIVFVDASTDNTPEKIRSMLEGKINFKIIKQRGQGLGDARQEIFEYAKDKYDLIVFLDTDRIPKMDWFENHIKFHERDAKISILSGRLVERDYEVESPFKDVNYFIQCNCSVKTDALKKIGGYDRRFKRGEDWDTAIRLYMSGARSVVSRKVAVRYAEKESTWLNIKKKLNRPSSIPFLLKYKLWYAKVYPTHVIGDIIGLMMLFLLLISIALLPFTKISLFLFGLLLAFQLVFSAGLAKYSKLKLNCIEGLLLPYIYGISVLKSLKQIPEFL